MLRKPKLSRAEDMSQAIRQAVSDQSAVQCEIVRTQEGFDQLQPAWDALFQQAHNPSPPLSYEWLQKWLDIYGEQYLGDESALRIICCWRGRDLVGVLPLYVRRQQRVADGGTHLAFISTGEQQNEEICPDYLDMLCLADVKDYCIELAWRAILQDMAGDYDRIELKDVADHSGVVKWARAHGAASDIQIVPRGVCPIADMHGGFEAYLSRLSSNTRQQGRRLLRAAAQAGVQFQVATTPEEVREFFGEMVDLHQRRWEEAGQPGCFASESFEQFHRQLAEQWVPAGRAVLSRIVLQGQTLAVKYGFRVGAKFDFYQSGIRMDDASPIKSPGIVSFLMLMNWLCGQGVAEFDFLRGSSAYKQRLATTVQPLVEVRRVLWTWRTGLGCAVDLGSRCARRARRLWSTRTEDPPHLRREALGDGAAR